MISTGCKARFWDLGSYKWYQQHWLVITCWNQSCSSGCRQHVRFRHSKCLFHSNHSLTSLWFNERWGVFPHWIGFLFLQSCLSQILLNNADFQWWLIGAKGLVSKTAGSVYKKGVPSEVCSKAVFCCSCGRRQNSFLLTTVELASFTPAEVFTCFW